MAGVNDDNDCEIVAFNGHFRKRPPLSVDTQDSERKGQKGKTSSDDCG